MARDEVLYYLDRAYIPIHFKYILQYMIFLMGEMDLYNDICISKIGWGMQKIRPVKYRLGS